MGRKVGSSCISLMVLFFLIVQYMVQNSDMADAIGAPSVTIVLDENKKSVDVSPGSTGVVTFNGTVTAVAPIMPPGQVLIVTLQADAGGWPVSNPPSMEFTNNVTEQPFSVSVQVPIETSQRTQGQLSVSGRWRYSPGSLGGTVDPATAIIEIEQYHSYSVSPAEMVTKMGTDSVSGVVFDIFNKGNGADRMTLEVMNEDELEGSGIKVSIGTSDISVPEKQTREYPLGLITSPSTPPGKHEIEVRIHSIQAVSLGKNYSYEFSSCFIDVIEGYVEEEPAPLPTDDDVGPDDNNTFDPGTYDPEISVPASSIVDRIMIYVGIIFAALVILILALYLLRKVRS